MPSFQSAFDNLQRQVIEPTLHEFDGDMIAKGYGYWVGYRQESVVEQGDHYPRAVRWEKASFADIHRSEPSEAMQGSGQISFRSNTPEGAVDVWYRVHPRGGRRTDAQYGTFSIEDITPDFVREKLKHYGLKVHRLCTTESCGIGSSRLKDARSKRVIPE